MWPNDAFVGAGALVRYHAATIGERIAGSVLSDQRPRPRVADNGTVSIRWQFGVPHTHFTVWFRRREVSWEAKVDGARISQGRFLPDCMDRKYESNIRRAQAALCTISHT